MRLLVALALLTSCLACSATTGSGGGGGVGLADVKGCDAKTASGCIGFTAPDGSGDGAANDTASLGDSDGSDNDTVGSSDAATDDSSVADSGSTDDIGDLDGFFDNPDTVSGGSDTITNNSNCNERAKIVYVVTEQNQLLSFTPDKLTLKLIGTLNCNASGTPFSMSVDRNANAWVLYQAGTFSVTGEGIFKVSTLDATCQSTSYKPNTKGLELFGMGFSSNGFGAQDETLFIAGGAASSFQTTKNLLGSIAFPSMAVSNLATIDIAGGADLTGNGKGELFGFFPDSSPPSVRQIDKTNGTTTGQSWPLPASVFNNTQAWAFAQWGGNFYLFFQSITDPSTNVWKLDPTTGQATKVLSNIGYTVTGAGVSSCAPTGAAP